MRTLAPFHLIDEMDNLFKGFSTPQTWGSYDERGFAPPCDVAESDDHFLMSFELPGIKKEDLKIEASGNVLTVSGEKRREWPSEESHKTQRFERSYGFFKRSFTLPTTVDANGIEAQYKDGVLQLFLPKAQSAKARKIEVQSGESGFFSRLLNPKGE